MTLRATSRRSPSIGWKSSRVTIALTPGNAAALAVRMAVIRAWAWGVRRVLPTSMPGAGRAAPKRARPVTLSMPSGRTGRVPTMVKDCVLLSSGMAGLPQFRGGRLDRAHDLVVAGAAAEIAGQPETDLGLRGVGVPVEQRLGRDQEPGRTDAALQGRMLQELALQRMQRLARGHALDGADLTPLGLGAQHQAGEDEAVVEDDAAGAAIAGAAAFFAASEAEPVAQHVEQALLGLAEIFGGVAVDGGGDVDA